MGTLTGGAGTSHRDIVRSFPVRWSTSAEGCERASSCQTAATPFGTACTPLEASTHKRRCVFVDATQQIIAAASGDGSQDRRTKRKRTTASQLGVLVASFAQSDAPSYEVREELAARCDMTNREVQVWFQNRRAKVSRERQRASGAESAGSRSPTPNNEAVASTRPGPPSQSRWRPEARESRIAQAFEPYPYALASQASEPSRLLETSPRAPSSTENWTVYWRQEPEPVRSPSASSMSGSDSLSLPASTPSLVSPGARSASSYFSVGEPTTPQSLPSPTRAFFRLALESPQATTPDDWFDKASESVPASGTLHGALSLPPLLPRETHSRSPPPLTISDSTLRARAASIQSAPPSPTMAHSHRVPSLRNLLNPVPTDSDSEVATGMQAALLKRSLSDSSQPWLPPRALTRPPFDRRAATFHVRLATIESRSPSAFDADSAPSPADPSSRRASLALSTFESDSVPLSARATGEPAAGLGILAAAAVYIDSQVA